MLASSIGILIPNMECKIISKDGQGIYYLLFMLSKNKLKIKKVPFINRTWI